MISIDFSSESLIIMDLTEHAHAPRSMSAALSVLSHLILTASPQGSAIIAFISLLGQKHREVKEFAFSPMTTSGEGKIQGTLLITLLFC